MKRRRPVAVRSDPNRSNRSDHPRSNGVQRQDFQTKMLPARSVAATSSPRFDDPRQRIKNFPSRPPTRAQISLLMDLGLAETPAKTDSQGREGDEVPILHATNHPPAATSTEAACIYLHQAPTERTENTSIPRRRNLARGFPLAILRDRRGAFRSPTFAASGRCHPSFDSRSFRAAASSMASARSCFSFAFSSSSRFSSE